MRRLVVFFLFILSSPGIEARDNPAVYLKPISVVYGVPLGGLSYRNSKGFAPGKALPGVGAEGTFGLKVTNNWIFGLGYQLIPYKHNQEATRQWFQDKYKKDGYYYSSGWVHEEVDVSTISLIVSKEFDCKYFSIAPFVNAGLGIFAGLAEESVYLKKMNDNYWEKVHLFGENNSEGGRFFFFPKLGITVSKKVYRNIHLTGNANFGSGSIRYKTVEYRENFLGENERRDVSFKQNISAFTASFGIEIRFRKRPSEEEKAKYNIK